jgi:hypothetical protein
LHVNKLKLLAVVPLAGAALILSTGTALAAPSVTASPTSGLSTGAKVTVTGSGFKANEGVAIIQCKVAKPTAAQATTECNIGGMAQGTTDGSGNFSVALTVDSAWGNYVGAGALDQSESANAVTISFGSASSSSSSAASSSSSTASSTTTSAPAVSAGTGGNADRNGLPTGVIVLGALGALAIAGGAVRFARR